MGMGNSDERAEQIVWRNEDKTLGILKTNLELKHNVHVHDMFSSNINEVISPVL